ncbi:phosphotransferase family protein [Candidatus Nanohalobium constans]|uniref:Phosphotransferase n=1 Tax=Candidatus Nanohalobium constans TaxID=2565781 RepID=A0A5Q0UH76_9ARCH|nr:aminoglycoside phosphotransferase family protein [Candidatus Nanohalobium constans]QGA80977.1 phosphotransferase [Candidatus Nanohalobium constans]
MNQDLKDEIESELGTGLDWEEVGEGLNTIYKLSSEAQTYILKIHTNHEGMESERFRAETEVLKNLHEKTEINTPEVVLETFSEGSDHEDFFVMEELEGESADQYKQQFSQSELEGIIFQYGEILARFHENTGFDEYGVLVDRGEGLEMLDGADKWTWSVEGLIDATESIIEDKWDEKPELYTEEAKKNLDELPENPKSVLLHQDNRLDNLLIKDDKINALIDWSHVRAGHNEYDLVKTEYDLIEGDLDFLPEEQKEKLKKKLYEGYRQEKQLETDKEFQERRNLYLYAITLWNMAGFPNYSSDWEEDRYKEKEEELKSKLKKNFQKLS